MKQITKKMAACMIAFMSLAFVVCLPVIARAATNEYLKMSYPTYSKYVNADDFNIAYSSKNVKNIKWKSSDTSVATVDKNGKVSIKGSGSAVITVSAKGKSSKSSYKAKTRINVAEPVLSCKYTDITMKKGSTKAVYVTVKNYPGYYVEWSSSNEDIVSVYSKDAKQAVLTAVDYGDVTITASIEEVGEVEIQVTVQQPTMVCPVNSVDLEKGKSKQVTVTLTNVPSSDIMEWESSDMNVAVLAASGASNRKATITARNYGTATITGYLGGKESGLSVTIQVNVINPTIRISSTSKNIRLGKSGSVSATTKYMPVEDYVEWTVDDPSIVSISASGTRDYKVTYVALQEGDAVITGTVPGGNSASFTVHVTP